MKKYRNYIFYFLFIFLFSSCYTNLYIANYKMNLKEVRIKKKIIKASKNSCEDSLFVFSWKSDTMSFNLQIKNKSNMPVRISWEKAYFTFPNGETSQIIHTNTKYLSSEKSKLPTVIAKNKSVTEMLFPENNIAWIDDTTYYWKEKSFMKDSWGMEYSDAAQDAENNVNQKLHVTIPFFINNKYSEYVFVFSVSQYDIKKIKEYDTQTTYGAALMTGGLVCFLLFTFIF
ncbi:MAG: hypothetical protein PHD97_05675 [Bacteroidales bacterium]|nr:hypothetical protein [Bacteroidales bacterium]